MVAGPVELRYHAATLTVSPVNPTVLAQKVMPLPAGVVVLETAQFLVIMKPVLEVE